MLVKRKLLLFLATHNSSKLNTHSALGMLSPLLHLIRQMEVIKILNTVGPGLSLTTKFKSQNYSNYPLAVGLFFAGSTFQSSSSVTAWSLLMNVLPQRCGGQPCLCSHPTRATGLAWLWTCHGADMHMHHLTSRGASYAEFELQLHNAPSIRSATNWSGEVRVTDACGEFFTITEIVVFVQYSYNIHIFLVLTIIKK